jgi:hypothetical protein
MSEDERQALAAALAEVELERRMAAEVTAASDDSLGVHVGGDGGAVGASGAAGPAAGTAAGAAAGTSHGVSASGAVSAMKRKGSKFWTWAVASAATPALSTSHPPPQPPHGPST